MMQPRRVRRWKIIATVVSVLVVLLMVSAARPGRSGEAVHAPTQRLDAPAHDANTKAASTQAAAPTPSPPSADPHAQLNRIAALASAADRGDPLAMRELAEIGVRCISMGYARARFDTGVDQVSANLARTDEKQAAYYRRAAQRLKVQCDALARDGMQATAHQWRRRAAQAGDLPARIIERMGGNEHEPVAALLDEVLASGDGASLNSMAFLLASGQGRIPGSYEGIIFSEHDAYAMSLLACERGLDCGPGSAVADEMCLTGLSCSGQAYDVLVREHLSMDGGMEQTEARLQWLRGLMEAPVE